MVHSAIFVVIHSHDLVAFGSAAAFGAAVNVDTTVVVHLIQKPRLSLLALLYMIGILY